MEGMIGETGRLRAAGHLLGGQSDCAGAWRPLPITRATALRRWRTAILTIGTVEFLVVLSRVLPPTPTHTLGERVYTLVEALAVPILLVFSTWYAERRLLGRPPKSLMAVQLGLFCLGMTLAAVPARSSFETEILGVALAALALILGAGWFLGVLVVSPLANEA